MKTITLLFCTLFTICLQGQNFDDVQINTQQLSDNMYVLFGAGGNIGLLTGPDGVVMIDAQFAELSPKIKAVADSLSTSEIRYLVNTHWHGDHTGGNAHFARYGATIIAHDNVRERLKVEQIRPFRRSTPASPEIAWPKLTFNEEMNIYINGETMHLIHVHNAHTDGDSFVYLPEQNILHMGDCFFRSRFPFVDLEMGGSYEGAIAAVEAALLICDENTQIIPGHGTLSNKQHLSDYLQMMKIMKERVVTSIDNGVTLENADIAALTKGYEAWGTGFISPEKFIKMLYASYE